PDGEKVSGEFELSDKREFFFDLAAGFALHIPRGAAITVAEADPGLLAQVRVHRLAFRDGIAREFVAEIVEREFEAGGKLLCVVYGVSQVGEKLLWLLWRFHV